MIITFGEILLRLSTPNHLRLAQSTYFDIQFGGSESNVAISLAQWGHKVAHVTRIPEHALGQSVLRMLRSHAVDTSFVQTCIDRLGTYYLETGSGVRASQVIYDRSESGMARIKPGMIDWEHVFSDAKWFHCSGITPALSISAAETLLEACETAHKLGIRISIDLNYRAKLWQYGKKPADIMPGILRYCDVVFGGIDAPEKMLGIVPTGKQNTSGMLTDENILSIFDQLRSKFPKITVLGTTLRFIKDNNYHQLQGVLHDGHALYKANLADMPSMIDRVGGGDAFVAGLLHGILTFGTDYKRIVNFANAASVLKHYTLGDVNYASLADVETVINHSQAAIQR